MSKADYWLLIVSFVNLSNISKCLHLIITNKHHIVHFDYHICGQLIRKVFEAKYLCVMFNGHLNWKHHIANVRTKS